MHDNDDSGTEAGLACALIVIIVGIIGNAILQQENSSFISTLGMGLIYFVLYLSQLILNSFALLFLGTIIVGILFGLFYIPILLIINKWLPKHKDYIWVYSFHIALIPTLIIISGVSLFLPFILGGIASIVNDTSLDCGFDSYTMLINTTCFMRGYAPGGILLGIILAIFGCMALIGCCCEYYLNKRKNAQELDRCRI